MRLLGKIQTWLQCFWNFFVHNLVKAQIRRAWDERAILEAQRQLVLLHRTPRPDLAHVLLAPETKLH